MIPTETRHPVLGKFKAIALFIILISVFTLSKPSHPSVNAPKNQAKPNQEAYKEEIKLFWTVHVAQTSYFGEFNTYGKTFEDIQWAGPEKPNLYHYTMGQSHIKAEVGKDVGEKCGTGNFPNPSGASSLHFIAHASASIDDDPYIDGWEVNDEGQQIHVCDVYHHH